MFDWTKGTKKTKEMTLVVIYNPNAWAVTATEKGEILPGYDWARVWNTDQVAKRAVERGLLLVPSAQ